MCVLWLRLETAEENCKKIEVAKFDLVIANANLQEKVVKLQAAAKIEVRVKLTNHVFLSKFLIDLLESSKYAPYDGLC